MKGNLYFCVDGHAPALVMIGTGSPYAIHRHADGTQHRTTAIVRDVEVGATDKDGYKAWHANLEAKHSAAAMAAEGGKK